MRERAVGKCSEDGVLRRDADVVCAVKWLAIASKAGRFRKEVADVQVTAVPGRKRWVRARMRAVRSITRLSAG